MRDPLATSHSLIVSSSDPEARSFPSAEKATERTDPLWPERVRMRDPLATSHSSMSSYDPEARSFPSAEKATQNTKPWPESVWIGFTSCATPAITQTRTTITRNNPQPFISSLLHKQQNKGLRLSLLSRILQLILQKKLSLSGTKVNSIGKSPIRTRQADAQEATPTATLLLFSHLE